MRSPRLLRVVVAIAASATVATTVVTGADAPTPTAIASPAAADRGALIDGVFRYGFSECVNNERTLFYYADAPLSCAADGSSTKAIAKPPVHGLRCDVVCDKGYFLGANFSTADGIPVSGCEKCPRGQYSLGGGRLFSQRTKAWTKPLPMDIHTECVTRNLYTNAWQNNCHPWVAAADGSMVSSGDNSNILERFEAGRLFSSLRISATFVRRGSITFQYRVSAEPPYDGLVFGVDDRTVMPVVSRSDGWEEVIYDVNPGAHTFAWDYTKDYSGDEGEDRAYLKVIELVGTAFADTTCHPCGADALSAHGATGGSLCAFCDADQYAAPMSVGELDFACFDCPEGMFSPKGSIGLESCVTRRPCTLDDVQEEFTTCRGGKRNVSYVWSEPQTCETDLPGAVKLPGVKVDAPCDVCEPGLRLSADDTCERCPKGEHLQGAVCTACPAGEVVVNRLSVGRGTKDGWSTWPAIIDQEAAKRAGWKLTRDGLVFDPPSTSGGATGGSSSAAKRFPIPFNVTYLVSGKLELTYALENVPTFASAGTRAWLELEAESVDGRLENDKTDAGSGATVKPPVVDDGEQGEDDDDDDLADVDGDGVDEQILHLANGATNGTSTETIEFPITKPTKKQFRLVLRASSPKAQRLIRVKIMSLHFEGTEEGAGVGCGPCPLGSQAVHSADFYGCQICPAGTHSVKSADAGGIYVCEKCPANTWSAPGATNCTACGANTYSAKGSANCAAPTILRANSSANSPPIRYDLDLLQSLVWGNSSVFDGVVGDSDGGDAIKFLSADTVTPTDSIGIDKTTTLFTGIFRPITKQIRSHIAGQILEDLIDSTTELPYIIQLHITNPQDAGGFFQQATSRYGDVQCSVPEQWKLTSGGNRMGITPLEDGKGVDIEYTHGTACKSGKLASTTIHFVCDVKAGAAAQPSSTRRQREQCHTEIDWPTSYACPICTSAYFAEVKSSCSGGQQSITYNALSACHGGVRPESVPISTCSDVVLDSKAIYTAYAAISIVAVIVILLLAAVLIVHRKYRNAYNDYLYLKGKMPVNEVITKDGSKESTFEFTPKSTALHESPGFDPRMNSPPSSPGDDGEEEEKKDDLDEIRISSV